MAENTRFIMKGYHGYAHDIAVYGSTFYDVKIFDGDPKEYEKYGNEIITLGSEKMKEIVVKEMQKIEEEFNGAEKDLMRAKNKRDRFYNNMKEFFEFDGDEVVRPRENNFMEIKRKTIGDLCDN